MLCGTLGLSGTPGVWSHLLPVLFGKLPFVVVYLDDLRVFSKCEAEHIVHIRAIFEMPRAEQLFERMSKCAFDRPSVVFLGHSVSTSGLEVNRRTTQANKKWPGSQNVKDFQICLGLLDNYIRFICDFTHLVLPLNNLLKETASWV
jgi:hypothetical protein